MIRDLLPAVMGSGVGVGIAAAVALFPGSDWTVGGVAGAVIGAVTAGAFHALPRHLKFDRPIPGQDDGSGERAVWSSHQTESLSAFAAWAQGDSVLADSDATQEMRKPDLDDRTAVYSTGLLDLRIRRPKGKRRASEAGVR